MNDLYSFFLQRRNTRPMHKWHHYFEVYERHFGRFAHANPAVLEIGVGGGGTLEMWREYFGKGARMLRHRHRSGRQEQRRHRHQGLHRRPGRPHLPARGAPRGRRAGHHHRRRRAPGQPADHQLRGAVPGAERERRVSGGGHPHRIVGRRLQRPPGRAEHPDLRHRALHATDGMVGPARETFAS